MRQVTRESVRLHLEHSFGVGAATVAGLARRASSGRRTSSPHHLIVAGPGGGSVGDQAMLEAFMAGAEGRVTVIVQNSGTITSELPRKEEDVRVVPLPKLLYGSTKAWTGDAVKFLLLARSVTSVSIIGADTMDGVYSVRASDRRFTLAYMTSIMGIPSRVLGFSWNDNPAPAARNAMVRSSKRVDLLARDPLSLERLEADGAESGVQVADLAFLIEPDSSADGEFAHYESWVAEQHRRERQVVLLNVNSHLNDKYSQVPLFIDLIHSKLDSFSFVLLPHDTRGETSDEALASTLRQEFVGDDRLFSFEAVVSPSKVARVAANASFTITGRMHLAILSSVSTTPALALGYQGKVEGLYQLLGLTHFMDASTVTAESLDTEFTRIAVGADDARATLSATLPSIRTLAERNIP